MQIGGKIGVITYHRAVNYGAVLQAYALQQFIRQKGFDCQIIDYRCEQIEKEQNILKLSSNSIKRNISAIVNAPIKAARKRAFEHFRKKHFILGTQYTCSNISDSNERYSKFIFGSDQIWNNSLNGNDFTFLGDFVSDKTKKFSYAASFGKTEIPATLCERYKEELSRFNKIAVRETSGQSLVHKMTGISSEVVVDPVFLLKKEQWKRLVPGNTSKGKYIFLYHLQGNNTKLMKYAEYLSRQTGLKIIEFQAWAKIRKRNVNPRFGDSPEEFLDWICNAEYVVTDSFHCTAFSIIFEKNFWARIDPQKGEKESRVGNLLHNIGLQTRILPEKISEWEYTVAPDFSEARVNLENQINKSIKYIDSVLESK